jgi:hypothetical protein
VPGAGIPGARTASGGGGGGGTHVVFEGLGKQERRRRQRAYLGVDEARGHGLVAAAGAVRGWWQLQGGGGGGSAEKCRGRGTRDTGYGRRRRRRHSRLRRGAQRWRVVSSWARGEGAGGAS